MKGKPVQWGLGAFLAGLGLVLLGNAAFIVARDPLLFWAARATPAQPLFATARQGNFSRFVFAGLMRSLDYRVIWVGPSYATPFASGKEAADELMVSMGNMTAVEMARILELEAHLGKADVVNLVISPVHCTPLYYATAKQWTFPDRLYSGAGGSLYLLDFSMDQLAFAYVSGERRLDFRSAAYRPQINRQYFWMPYDQKLLTDYWTKYGQAGATRQQLVDLRQNLVKALDPGNKIDLVETDAALAGLFRAVRGLRAGVAVNIIFPPAHLTYWAQTPETIAQMLHVRNALHAFARMQDRVKLFDFATDWEAITNRTLYYDSAHFTDRDVATMRKAIHDGRERFGGMESILHRYLGMPAAFDAEQVAALAKGL